MAVFDPNGDTEPTRYPVSQTPLKIILERTVDLENRDMVVEHISDDVHTAVTLQDPDNPDLGFIKLIFSNDPIQLRQWVIKDQSDGQTIVTFSTWEEGAPIPSVLFNITGEILRRERENR